MSKTCWTRRHSCLELQLLLTSVGQFQFPSGDMPQPRCVCMERWSEKIWCTWRSPLGFTQISTTDLCPDPGSGTYRCVILGCLHYLRTYQVQVTQNQSGYQGSFHILSFLGFLACLRHRPHVSASISYSTQRIILPNILKSLVYCRPLSVTWVEQVFLISSLNQIRAQGFKTARITKISYNKALFFLSILCSY